jgi:rhodanese-related sulfurtransferase/DNA-binding transcriptional ArsR family regulator
LPGSSVGAALQSSHRRLLFANETMGNRKFKVELYGHFARVGKAFSNGHRLEILELLAQGQRTVDSLAKELELSMANTSAHLHVLKETRLVESKKEGLFVHYRLADDSVYALLQSVRTIAEKRIAEVDRLVHVYLADREQVDAVSFEELTERLKSDTVILLDVRPSGEFEAGHISGAVSIPYNQIEARMREIPRGTEVVAYCRGPYCVFADEAVQLLRARRRKARRLASGLPDWKAAGLPVTMGP